MFFQIFIQLSERLCFVIWVGRFANGKLKSCPNVFFGCIYPFSVLTLVIVTCLGRITVLFALLSIHKAASRESHSVGIFLEDSRGFSHPDAKQS